MLEWALKRRVSHKTDRSMAPEREIEHVYFQDPAFNALDRHFLQ